MRTDFISADGHFNEPKDFYQDIGSANAPKIFEIDKRFFWGVNNKAIRPIGLDHQAGVDKQELEKFVNFSDVEAFCDLDKRKKFLFQDGIIKEVLYPSGALLNLIEDEQLRYDCFCFYNSFIREKINHDSEQFYAGITMLPVDTVTASKVIATVNDKEDILIPCYLRDELYSDSNYKELLFDLLRKNCRIHLHAGGLRGLPSKSEVAKTSLKNTIMVYHAMETLSDWYLLGVFDQFPYCTIVLSETGIGWLPYFADRLDYSVQRYSRVDGYSVNRSIYDVLQENIWMTFQNDLPNEEVALLLNNKLFFGSDFPHAESTYPNSDLVYEKYLKVFGQELANKFFYDNAAKFYFNN